MSLQTFVQVQYEGTTINHYIVIITIKFHMYYKENSGTIKTDCWKPQILLGTV
jgi:hypothetical protein